MEENIIAKTISFVKGRGHLSHNNRTFLSSNVDASRVELNRYYVRETLEEAYQKCFGQALADYNAKQKRADRKKGDYITEIKNSKNNEKVFYENVVQIGDKDDTGVLLPDGSKNPSAEIAALVLERYVQTFQERNPNLYLFNAVLHMDEATPHLHLDYIPVAHGYKTGMETRNSLTKAFQQMGIQKAESRKQNETVFWQERERAYIKELARKMEIEIYEKGDKRENLTLPEYKAAMAEVNSMKEQQAALQVETAALAEEKEVLQAEIVKRKEEHEVIEAELEAYDNLVEEINREADEGLSKLETFHLRKNALETAERALKYEKADTPVATKEQTVLGKETGFVKVKIEDWKNMLAAYKNARKRIALVDGYEKQIKEQTGFIEKCRQFFEKNDLWQKFRRFVAPKTRKAEHDMYHIPESSRVSIRERLAKHRPQVEAQKAEIERRYIDKKQSHDMSI